MYLTNGFIVSYFDVSPFVSLACSVEEIQVVDNKLRWSQLLYLELPRNGE
jgi:hypothetical protein